VEGAEVFLEIGEALDIDKELERIEKELASVAKEIERCESKLGNPNFIERARPDIVEEERRRLATWQEKRAKLEERRRMLETRG
jgi:valyl-tRNA synthetase